jgi:hypothetical protein
MIRKVRPCSVLARSQQAVLEFSSDQLNCLAYETE